MILAAGLLVLLGLGLFVAGLATGTTVLYWATVGVCAVAVVLLVISRRRLPAPAAEAPAAGETAAAPRAGTKPAAGRETEPAAAPAEAATAAAHAPRATADEEDEPPVEDVEVTDVLLVVDLKDEVLVVDEHPRYHLTGCLRLAGRTTIPLPIDEARADGFTPCGVCAPDRHLAERERARRSGRAS